LNQQPLDLNKYLYSDKIHALPYSILKIMRLYVNLYDFMSCDMRRIEVSWLMIVDDNELFRTVLRSTLMHYFDSIDILEAGSAEKALAKISDDPPFLVFVDIQLPGENGLQLTRKIKHLYPETLVVVCTTFDSNEYRRAAYQVGADYFVPKSSMEIKKFVDMIQSHIDKE
jgi:DNA-binding NarL/FixJ family response regulator